MKKCLMARHKKPKYHNNNMDICEDCERLQNKMIRDLKFKISYNHYRDGEGQMIVNGSELGLIISELLHGHDNTKEVKIESVWKK